MGIVLNNPGNSKTLWDATKIAMDKECINIPNTIHLGQNVYKNEDIPEAFAKFFKDKVDNITHSTAVDELVFNGTKIIDLK